MSGPVTCAHLFLSLFPCGRRRDSITLANVRFGFAGSVERRGVEIVSLNLPSDLPVGDILPSPIAAWLPMPTIGTTDVARGIGGPDVTQIMAGDWLALWEERPDVPTPGDLPVILGAWIKALVGVRIPR